MNLQKNKISIAAIITAVISIGIVSVNLTSCSSLLKEVANNSDTEKSDADEKILFQTSSEMNKKLPMMVDRSTRIDTTTPGPGKMLTYKYTLVDIAAADIDKEKFKQKLLPTLIENYKTNPATQSMRKAGIIIKFKYFDKKGVFITDMTVDPKDLK
jgi:hypothetical protein